MSLPHPTITEIETLIPVLLVCDWNVRAWKMLEAIRDSRSIFLLCKNEQVVNLRDILVTLHQHGVVDIAVLLGRTQHLIPHSDPRSTKTVEEASYPRGRKTSSSAGVCRLMSPARKEPGSFGQGGLAFIQDI
jgi:hypothetical protein